MSVSALRSASNGGNGGGDTFSMHSVQSVHSVQSNGAGSLGSGSIEFTNQNPHLTMNNMNPSSINTSFDRQRSSDFSISSVRSHAGSAVVAADVNRFMMLTSIVTLQS